MRENRFKWFSRVIRRGSLEVVRVIMQINVGEKRRLSLSHHLYFTLSLDSLSEYKIWKESFLEVKDKDVLHNT